MRRRLVFSVWMFLLLATAFGVALNVPMVKGANVGEVIAENTVWTLENSPYVFVNDVTIASGAILTIDPGVTVNLDLWLLIVEGTLHARGNETYRIKFQTSERPLRSWPSRIYFADGSTSWNETTGTGCIIEYAEINVVNYQYETILGGSPKISKNIIFNYGNDAAAIRGGRGIISNNTITGGYRGIVTEQSEGGLISYNVIKETGTGGAIAVGFETAPMIFGNLLVDNIEGITFWGSSGTHVSNNTIVRNSIGFRFTNYITELSTGEIIYNNIYSNGYDVKVEKEDPRIAINMTGNWWGTTDTSIIDIKIHDQKDDRRLSLVDYTPFLTTPPVSIDSAPPATSHNYLGVWHISDFNILLTAIDDLSGVVEIYYKVNDLEVKRVSINGQPLITTEGENNKMEYWSTDYCGNEESHHLLTGIKLDKTAPTGSVEINDGATYTTSASVALTLTQSDGTSGVYKVTYSNDAMWDTEPWETPSSTKAWTLTSSDGTKTVYYQIKDWAELISTYSDTIILDTTPPSGSIIIAADAASTNATSTVLTLSAGDDVSSVAHMCLSNDNITWTPWEAYSTSKAWTLTTGDGTKAVYVQFKDDAGLNSSIYQDTIVLDTTKPTANAGTNQTVNEDTLVTFNSSASTDENGIVAYDWVFIDVTSKTLTGKNPTYTFATPGTYTISLKITDFAGNWATDTMTITVLDITEPVADAGQDQTVIEWTTVSFDASGSSDNLGIADYEWDFGDGLTATGKTATHTYAGTGIYMVTLTVKDAAGNTATDFTNVTVNSGEAPPPGETFPMWIAGVAIALVAVAAAVILLLRKRR